jgi:hypothetical protein
MNCLKWIFTSAFCLCLFTLTQAQTNAATGKNETERLVVLNEKMQGTFQIQIIDSREKPAFPLSSLDEINSKRAEDKDSYIWLKSNIRILILSKKEISKKDFQPIERVKYITSSEL